MSNKVNECSNKLLREVEELRKKLSDAGSPLNNNEIWSIQQALQVTCGNLLISFQEIALEKGVERDLWNFGFRTTITQLQSQTKDKKKVSSDAKDVLTWFLSSASGFYLQLLNQVCSVNSLDLVFRRKDSVYGLVGGGLSSIIGVKTKENVTKNALYLCQYCLIHLGDLARYRHQAKQAETYYRHAVTVAPTSGHPYNQLALLEAGRGNRLTAVFLYIRALCVPAPFPGAPSNLIQTLSKVLSQRSKEECKPDVCEIKVGNLTRMTKEEYINLFLHFHSSLFLKGDLEAAKDDLPRLSSALSMLVATTTLTRSSLVQIFTVSVFAVHYFSGRFTLRGNEENANKKDEEKLIEPKECEGALDTLDDLIVAILAALLLPIHTMKESEVVLAYPALPTILLMLEWISSENKLSSPALKKKQQIWPGLCTLVNFMQLPLKNFEAQQFNEMPLPEDWDLQEFQPLQKILSRYKYRESTPRLNPEQYSLLRANRITALAIKFCEERVDGSALIKQSTSENGLAHFEPMSNQAAPVEEVLDLERLTLQPKQEQPAASGVSSKKEKKVGILKPQGSLERSKAPGSKDQNSPPGPTSLNVKDSDKKIISPHAVTTGEKRGLIVPGVDAPPVSTIVGKPKPMRTNVALQAILKRNSNTQESKQVTFQTPSPAPSPNPSDASSESQRSQATPPLPLSVAMGMQLAPPTITPSPLVTQNPTHSFPAFQQQRFPNNFRAGSGPANMPLPSTTLAQSYAPGPAGMKNFPLRENQGQQPPFMGLRGAPVNKGPPFAGNKEDGNFYNSQPLYNRGPFEANRGPPFESTNRMPPYELTNRGPSFEPTIRGPPTDTTNRGPQFEPTIRGPPVDANRGPPMPPTNRGPPFETTNRGPSFESTNRGLPFEPTNRGGPFESTNRAPQFESTNRGPLYETATRGPLYESANRGPSYETANRGLPYESANRGPIGTQPPQSNSSQLSLFNSHSQPLSVNWKSSPISPPDTGLKPPSLQMTHQSSFGNLFNIPSNPSYKDVQGFNLPLQQTMAPTSPKETPTSLSLFMDRGISRGCSNPTISQGNNLMSLASGQHGGSASGQYGGLASGQHGGLASGHGGLASGQHGGLASGQHGGSASGQHGGLIPGQHGGLASGQHGGLASGQHGGLASGQHGGLASGQHGGLASGQHGGLASGQHGGNTLRSSASSVFPGEGGSPGVSTPWWGKDGNGTRPGNQFQFSTLGSRPVFGREGGSPPSLDTSMPPPNLSSSQFQPLGGLGLTGVSPPYSMESSNSSEGSMRMPNTYSLFGPLGGGGRDSLQQPFQQNSRMLNPSVKQQNQQPQQQFPAHQSFWSGPSPLQRLLEQKKYNSK